MADSTLLLINPASGASHHLPIPINPGEDLPAFMTQSGLLRIGYHPTPRLPYGPERATLDEDHPLLNSAAPLCWCSVDITSGTVQATTTQYTWTGNPLRCYHAASVRLLVVRGQRTVATVAVVEGETMQELCSFDVLPRGAHGSLSKHASIKALRWSHDGSMIAAHVFSQMQFWPQSYVRTEIQIYDAKTGMCLQLLELDASKAKIDWSSSANNLLVTWVQKAEPADTRDGAAFTRPSNLSMFGQVMRPLQSEVEHVCCGPGALAVCWSPCGQFLVTECHNEGATLLQILETASLTCIQASVHSNVTRPIGLQPDLKCLNQGMWAALVTTSSQAASWTAIFPKLNLKVELDNAGGTWHAASAPSHPISNDFPAVVAPDGSCIVVNSATQSRMYQVDLPAQAAQQIGSLYSGSGLCSFAHFPRGWSAFVRLCSGSFGPTGTEQKEAIERFRSTAAEA